MHTFFWIKRYSFSVFFSPHVLFSVQLIFSTQFSLISAEGKYVKVVCSVGMSQYLSSNCPLLVWANALQTWLCDRFKQHVLKCPRHSQELLLLASGNIKSISQLNVSSCKSYIFLLLPYFLFFCFIVTETEAHNSWVKLVLLLHHHFYVIPM